MPRKVPAGHPEPRWMLLIHQIPPRPAYLRVKVGRHLQRIGAVAIKNSVYALPRNDETQEDFQWVLREVVKGGGDASIVEARFPTTAASRWPTRSRGCGSASRSSTRSTSSEHPGARSRKPSYREWRRA